MARIIKIFFLLFCSLAICVAAQTSKIKPIKIDDKIPEPPKEKSKKIKQRKMSVEERLKLYLYSREVRPAVIINNLSDAMNDKDEEVIDISTHKIIWYRLPKETKIQIDNDIFSLEGKKTLNFIENKKHEDIDFANTWDQIKLFKFGDREIIGISMVNSPCTGIGCRVMMYLIYDLKTKSKNFFGTYRFVLDREFSLYDFGNDGKLDFLSATYDDGNDGKHIEFANIYEIFTMNDKGIFQIQSDKNDKPFFMKRFYKEDNYEEINGKFQQNWIEQIK